MKYHFLVQRIRDTMPIGAETGIWLLEGGEGCIGSGVFNFCCRDQVMSYSSKSIVYNALIGHLDIDHSAYCEGSDLFISSTFYSNAIRLDDMSRAELGYITLGRKYTNVIQMEDSCSAIIENDIDGATPTGYVFNIQAGNNIIMKEDITLTGDTNDIFFTRSSTAHALPTAGTAITDNQGSFVLR
jgi:hypothetical protein